MQNKKSKHLLTIALASLIVFSTTAASVMTGCSDNKGSQKETKVVVETQVVTEIVEGTYATDSNGNTVANSNNNNNGNNNQNNNGSNSEGSEASENSNANSAEKSDTSKNNSSDSSKNNSSSKDNSSSSSSSDDKSSSASDSSSSKPSGGQGDSTQVLTINGEKFGVGDTVTCVYKLTCPEVLINYQATITYDSKYLKVTKAKLSTEASAGGILNYKRANEILFNGSNISTGYDFKKGGEFVTVTYEVKASGSTKTNFNWEVATGFDSDKAYVVKNKPVGGLKLSTVFS